MATKRRHAPERTLGAYLRELRDDRGTKQELLAEILAEDQSFVSRTETGERKLGLLEFCLYVEALDADPIDVLREFLRRDEEASARSAR